MNDTTKMIMIGKAEKGITNDYELATKIGLSRQAFSRKLQVPNSFKPTELKAIADLFGWSNEKLGEFLRTI